MTMHQDCQMSGRAPAPFGLHVWRGRSRERLRIVTLSRAGPLAGNCGGIGKWIEAQLGINEAAKPNMQQQTDVSRTRIASIDLTAMQSVTLNTETIAVCLYWQMASIRGHAQRKQI